MSNIFYKYKINDIGFIPLNPALLSLSCHLDLMEGQGYFTPSLMSSINIRDSIDLII